jgi:outer membrane protein
MKKHLIFVFAFFAINALNAQSNIAHMNSQEVMEAMPRYMDAIKKLEAYQNEIQIEINEMQEDFDEHLNKLQKMIADGESPTLIQIQRDKVVKKENALLERQQTAQPELTAYSRELNAPILYFVEMATNRVAKRYNYDYVLDKSVLLVSNGPDITKEVIEEVLKLEQNPPPPPQEDIIVTDPPPQIEIEEVETDPEK